MSDETREQIQQLMLRPKPQELALTGTYSNPWQDIGRLLLQLEARIQKLEQENKKQTQS